MGGDAERQLRFADLGEISIGEVFLAEMQMLGAGDDRGAPVIVTTSFVGVPLVIARASLTICSARAVVKLLGAQLDGADAEFGQALDPGALSTTG